MAKHDKQQDDKRPTWERGQHPPRQESVAAKPQAQRAAETAGDKAAPHTEHPEPPTSKEKNDDAVVAALPKADDLPDGTERPGPAPEPHPENMQPLTLVCPFCQQGHVPDQMATIVKCPACHHEVMANQWSRG